LQETAQPEPTAANSVAPSTLASLP
jgi:hypothetical protein